MTKGSLLFTSRDPTGRKHVVKLSAADRFEDKKKLQQPLADSKYLRAIRDSSSEHSLFVDIKPNNILLDIKDAPAGSPEAEVGSVKLANLGNLESAFAPPPRI
ncbi:hypothetical protein F503_00627 [Ophiostoma piceae UAMH 11346]|uniref:Uncharacterized protein n=1 Tax=Ophiostoma piceae (strain UAMH 11346) TaxID=1262450 RepID=S3D3I5_OPHP1|nr:hypothetical protein F503_00627 [Ophiostoma piceae UAMH 11346]